MHNEKTTIFIDGSSGTAGLRIYDRLAQRADIDLLTLPPELHHIDRLQSGECTLNHGFAFNDLLTNCERVSDHCSNIAVAMIELESDSFDTHEYINSVMAMHSHRFDEYYAEYSREFQI